jgi:hypothetical protein
VAYIFLFFVPQNKLNGPKKIIWSQKKNYRAPSTVISINRWLSSVKDAFEV